MPWTWEHAQWPDFRWDAAALATPLATARLAQDRIAGMARLLDATADRNAPLEVLTAEGLATSAIEGEAPDPHALRSSPARRLGCRRQDFRPGPGSRGAGRGAARRDAGP